jgi:glycosyltransferase involved in cell wall biosynthesis
MGRERLLYVITAADVGGAQAHVLDLIGGFRTRYDLHVATGEAGPLTEAARAQGVTVHLLRRLVRPISPLADALAIAECQALIRRLAPCLVHAHSSKAGLVARAAARRAEVPSLFTAHGWGFAPGVPATRRPLVWASEALAARLGGPIICVSEYDRRLAIRSGVAGHARLSTVYCGLPPAAPQAAPEREPPSVVMVARFFAQKDHAVALRAFAAVRHPDARLLLVGDGPGLDGCRRLVADLGLAGRVEFLGAREDVPTILARAQLFLLCSRYEGIPISVLEAMRAGLPVVASAVGGVPEAVQHGRTGLLAARGDVEGTAKALALLLGQPRLRAAMGRAGREHFLAHFTFEQMIERIGAIYERLQLGALAPAAA